MHPTYDEKDEAIRQIRAAQFTEPTDKPRQGEILIFPGLGQRRIAHVWPTTVQYTPSQNGSFYLGDGFMSYSGSLELGISRRRLERTSDTQQAGCWFFHHDHMCAHNGVHTTIPVRVWRVKPVYRTLCEAECEIDNWYSDLYVRATDIAREILSGEKYSTFKSAIDGQLWLDVPFAYLPHYKRR